jgi:hypothetical protein
MCIRDRTWTDNSASQTWTQVSNNNQITITWTATDECGNESTTTATYSITDDVDPTITCPVSTNVDEPDLFEDFVSGDGCTWNPTNVPDPIINDVCGLDRLVYTLSGATTGDSPQTGFNYVSSAELNIGITTVTYTVYDLAGNSATCAIRVWIKNIDDPHFSVICPSETSITVPVEPDVCAAEVTIPGPDIDNFCVEVFSATYQVDAEEPVSVSVPAPVSGISTLDDLVLTFDAGIHNVRWTIISASNTPYICDITVDVEDTEPPTIVCPVSTNPTEPDLFEEFVSDDGCEWDPTNVPNPTYDDDCGVVAVTYTLSGATTGNSAPTGFNFVSDAELNLGITTVTYTAWDLEGNSSEPCSIRIWIKNIDDPHFSVICPPETNITVPAETDECFAEVTIPGPGIDNFCVEVYNATYQIDSEEPVSVSVPAPVSGISTLDDLVTTLEVGVHNVRWTIISASNTPYICDITVEVEDLPPFVDCPDNYVFQADFEVPYKDDITVADPTYGDNCPNPVLEWILVEPDGTTYTGTGDPSGINILPNPRRYFLGVTTITYRITDSSNLTDECSFTVTVLDKPEITCPPDYETTTDPGLCTATRNSGDYGLPTLDYGVQPITWTWTITNPDGTEGATGSFVGSVADPGPPDIPNYDFWLGTSTITWRAENISGYDECSHLVIVTDEEPPTFVSAPYEDCVDMLMSVTYDPASPNPIINHIGANLDKIPSPDYSTFEAGNTELDLTDLNDNCCATEDLIINWRIDFTDVPDPINAGVDISHSTITGTGQPSEYGSNILLWGDGVYFTTITHQITYWVEDCNGNVTEERTETITITPRPQIIKVN